MSVLAEAILTTFDSDTQIEWDLRSDKEIAARFNVADTVVTTTFERIEGPEWG